MPTVNIRITRYKIFVIGFCFSVCSCISSVQFSSRECLANRPDANLEFPSSGVEIKVIVTKVSYPWLDSPSIVGDNSKAILKIIQGTIPGNPDAKQVVWMFDSGGHICGENRKEACSGPKVGEVYVLKLLRNNQCFDLEKG